MSTRRTIIKVLLVLVLLFATATGFYFKYKMKINSPIEPASNNLQIKGGFSG